MYEAFEKDNIKYLMYYEAIKSVYLAKGLKEYTVFYVGCGKAGILESIIRAAKETEVQIKVLLIEKNSHVLK